MAISVGGPCRLSASLLLLLILGSASALDVVQPDNCGGEYKEVRVDPCPDAPCKFQKGKSVRIEVDFTPTEDFDKVQASFKGEVTPGAWLPLPGFKKDACSRSGLQCPLEAGKQYTFSKTIRVLPAFPTLETKAECRLKGGNGTTIFCFIMPVKIE
ncbi:NPC intracellular cholesterol transporter 2-like [Haemaphysalis longicornis]